MSLPAGITSGIMPKVPVLAQLKAEFRILSHRQCLQFGGEQELN